MLIKLLQFRSKASLKSLVITGLMAYFDTMESNNTSISNTKVNDKLNETNTY